MQIVMKDLVKLAGFPPSALKNAGVTKKLADKLRAHGFTPTVRRIDGKLTRVWTNDLTFTGEQAEKTVRKLLGGN